MNVSSPIQSTARIVPMPKGPKRTLQLAVALLVIFASSQSVPAMYRWVDENGVTVYSQNPPPSSEAVKIKKQPAPSAEDAASLRKLTEERRARAFDEREARKQTEAEQAIQAEEERQRSSNCRAARNNLESFQNLGRRMIRTADGSVMRPSEDEVESEIEKAKLQIEEYCD